MAPKYDKDMDLNKDGEVQSYEREAYLNAVDSDGDGKASKKEKEAYKKKENKRDLLSEEELAKDYKYAYNVFSGNDELMELLQRATAGQWSTTKFDAELKGTQWWNDNNEYAREAYFARQTGGEDWNATVSDARDFVQKAATRAGAVLSPEQLDALADQSINEGWNRPGREGNLDRALSQYITADDNGFMRGEAGTLQQRLRQTAAANGLQLNDDYFESAARSVATGLTDDNYWLNKVRSDAASLWPTWSEQIMNGVDAYDLASGYINIMAETFEILPDSIDLNDAYIREAMTGLDEKGNPKPLGLWEFQQKLRKDPRWLGTKQAEDQVSNIANDVLKMFGFVGA